MPPPTQPGWTRLATATGRYEYQFQGSGPAVRAGRYLDARDFQFLVMDEEGWLYRIPVCVAAAIAGNPDDGRQRAEAQLRAGLERVRPRPNAPYEELDAVFAVRE